LRRHKQTHHNEKKGKKDSKRKRAKGKKKRGAPGALHESQGKRPQFGANCTTGRG